MVTPRNHERVVHAGDAVAVAGQYVVAAVVILAASGLAAALSTVAMLSVLNLVAGGGR